ncbi:MAG: hypothetical protein ACRDZ3_21685 [Acidimicrobiia bacterium]
MSRAGSFGGHGQALGELLRQATRMYLDLLGVLLPPFIVIFIALRELLLVVIAVEDAKPLALLAVGTLVQALIPAFVGSLLVAAAIPVLAGQARGLGEAWAGLADRRTDIFRAARYSSGLALFATVTLGPVGIIVQPVLLGPPLLIHEIVIRKHGVKRAWERVKEMMAADSRQLVYILAIPAVIGVILTIFLRAFGVLSGDIPGVARGLLYFAVQGALIGAAIPFVTAVGMLLYEEMASSLGGDEAG